ncbi:hypothetical protein Trydic_g15053 [Trypoxylus dichotomus]
MVVAAGASNSFITGIVHGSLPYPSRATRSRRTATQPGIRRAADSLPIDDTCGWMLYAANVGLAHTSLPGNAISTGKTVARFYGTIAMTFAKLFYLAKCSRRTWLSWNAARLIKFYSSVTIVPRGRGS